MSKIVYLNQGEKEDQGKQEVKPPVELEPVAKLIADNLILPKATDCDCRVTITKQGHFWKINATSYPITIRDRNEIMRQIKLFFKRYQRSMNLQLMKEQREAAEKEKLANV